MESSSSPRQLDPSTDNPDTVAGVSARPLSAEDVRQIIREELRNVVPVELVDADDLARMLCQSRPTVYRLNDDGRIPAPVDIGLRGGRWRVREIRAWIDAGMPVRNRWEQIKQSEMRRTA